jgi:hypothetical protein
MLDGSGKVIYSKAGDASVQDLIAVLDQQDSEPDSGWLSAPAESSAEKSRKAMAARHVGRPQ